MGGAAYSKSVLLILIQSSLYYFSSDTALHLSASTSTSSHHLAVRTMAALLHRDLPQYCYYLFALNLLGETVGVADMHVKLVTILNFLMLVGAWEHGLMQEGVAVEEQLFASAIISSNQVSTSTTGDVCNRRLICLGVLCPCFPSVQVGPGDSIIHSHHDRQGPTAVLPADVDEKLRVPAIGR